MTTTIINGALSLLSGGTANITLNNLQISGANASDFLIANTSCGSVLSSSCSVSINFSPSALGARTANLVVTSDAPGSPLTIPLFGTGLPDSSSLSLSSSSMDFGLVNVGMQNILQNSVGNYGSRQANFTLPTISGPNAGDFQVAYDNCSALPSYASYDSGCSIKVAFSPTAAGERQATLSIYSDAAAAPLQVALYGTGQTATYWLSASSRALDFGGQPVASLSTALTAQITNTGASSVTFSGFKITGANSADFILSTSQGSCAQSVSPGQTCVIDIQFLPTLQGPEVATLTISSNSSGGPIAIPLIGQGRQSFSQWSANLATIDFGAQSLATPSSAKSVTVQNTGNTPLPLYGAIVSGSMASSFFWGLGTCTNSLAPGATCTVPVTFTPTIVGPIAATLQLNAAGVSPITVSLTGTGQ